ncbi:MAG TPA: His/Gly/Thr/Pro-type tRNA ligase C-terminal domain-containing protein, partial [Acidimicrobiales bacterium]|nr:His/Gly/Thr/Pro-type tRNA ligase C-terminal domain-containing protein [Acidimicrobiales bacterium]
TGAKNAYFPLFIPESYLHKEAEHVAGFSPELAVVTHAGGEQLSEPIVVRPTSETVIGEFMAKWIQSYRDLPLLLNQWANVVRWELRPRLFLRSSEFLWQEGHTAHATNEDASAYAQRIHLEVYNDFLVNVLAAPTYLGIKPPSERFAGAINSMTCEGMMRDGKALQMATTHELGQNFARAFDINYQSEEGQAALCYTTSWGASTRLVGGLIMTHGDDAGLLVPPRLAPVQVVVVTVRDEPDVNEAADRVAASLLEAGVRVEIDRGRGSFGRRVTDWEIKGVPLRVEVGPRDLAQGVVTIVRRDNGEKSTHGLDALASVVPGLLETFQRELFESAQAYLIGNTHDVGSVADAIDAAKDGFARLDWDLVAGEGEREMNAQAVSVRCLQRRDGSMPVSDDEGDLICIVAKSY